jgi:methyl-accepting chemotaxis protein
VVATLNKPLDNANLSTNSMQDFTALATTIQALFTCTTSNDVIQTALDTIRRSFGWAYASYWALDESSQTLRFQQESGTVNPVFAEITRTASFARGVGLNGRAWDTGKLFFVEDLGDMVDCCRRETAQAAGVKSGVCIPLFEGSRLIGTMDFFMTERITLTDSRKQVMELTAQVVSSLMTSLTTFQEQLENSRALLAVMQTIFTQNSSESAISLALKTIQDTFGWAYGSFWRLDADSNTLKFAQETGQVTPEFSKVTREASFAKGVGLSGKTWQANDLVFVKDLGEMVDCCRRETAQAAGVKSGVCLPVSVNGQFIGTMDFFTTKVLQPSQDRLNTLRNVGNLLSNAISAIQRNETDREKADNIKNTAIALASYADDLKAANESILTSAKTSSTQADSVSQASLDISSRVSTVAAASEEMSATVLEISKQTSRAAETASRAEGVSKTTRQNIDKLDSSAREIGKVIEVIKSIAAQTNLLALNATIEAASAGDAGKGFAVVANEVKELAKQSASSVEDIRRRIEEIQQSTQTVIASIQEITEYVESINAINVTVASAVEEQSITTNEISQSAGFASQGVEHVAASIEELAQLAHETRQSVEIAQQSVQQLSLISEELKLLTI